jgi:lysophospholipid acyltransferase (LPLAT)-like uncharacterized protein
MIRARIFSGIGWFLVSLWSRTIKIHFVNSEVPERLTRERKNYIYAFFHGDLFLLLHYYRDSGVVIPASESRDGEIMAQLLKRFGFAVVRGSSKRKGQKALIALISSMRKGKHVAIAVDGPRGPLREVKAGVVFLAGVTKAPIIPVTVGVKNFWVMKKSWDKLMIPVPFTKGIIMYGDPIYVNGTSNDEIEYARKKIETDLQKLTQLTQVSLS